MKLMLGSTPIKKTMIHNDTQDATMVASDLQAGVTCYAKGQKVTGTGKSFEFAQYGTFSTNSSFYVPNMINVIEISSLDYPIKHMIKLTDMRNINLSTPQQIALVIIDNVEYALTARVSSNIFTVTCDKNINLEIFYGKDNYV